MKPWLAAWALGFATLIESVAATAAPVPDFHAVYRSVDGTAASTDVSSSHDAAAGVHTLVVKRTDDAGRESTRTLRFNIVDDRVRPIWYREEDRRCASCSVTIRFDWDVQVLQYDTRGEQGIARTSERDGRPIRLVRDVAMLVAMLPGRRELTVFDDALVVKPLHTVELETPLGRVSADGRALRGTWDEFVWLAQELDFLPVRAHAFGVTVQLSELAGIERSATARAVIPEGVAGATGVAIPEYRAIYRLDLGSRVGVGRFEVAVSHDRVAERYEFLATAVENKRPADVLSMRMPFRVAGDRVQPLSLHVEDRGRRALSASVEFDWTLLEALARFDGQQLRYSLVDFDDRDERSARIGLLEPLAALLAFLPGNREIAGLDDLLTIEPLGESEIALAIGSFTVERAALLGEGEDLSAEIWRARSLAGLPVRFSGPLMTRKAVTMELAELHGIERAAGAN